MSAPAKAATDAAPLATGAGADLSGRAARAAFGRLLRSEARLFARTPMAVLWGAILPVVALIGLGLIPDVRTPAAGLHGQSYFAAYLPILMAFALCMWAVNLMPPTLALYRETGVLRQLSTTPVRPAWLLGAQATIFAGVGIVESVLLLIVWAAYGEPLPGQPVGFALALLLIATSTLAIGACIAALARTAKAANAAAMAAFFPLMFLAGLWVPRAQMPDLLRRISDVSPLGAGVRALQDSLAGNWPSWGALLALAVWTLGGAVLGARAFRWA
jgi:ABC-2 type transport system permease protein